MLNEFDREELRRADEAKRRETRRLIRDSFAPYFTEPEPEEEYGNPNQPACTAGANGKVAARKAIALAQERKEAK
jgi:hypothetical protein